MGSIRPTLNRSSIGLKQLLRSRINIQPLLNGEGNVLNGGGRHAYENVIVWVLLALVLDILSVDVFRSLKNGYVRDK